jgi:hypothetical protein
MVSSQFDLNNMSNTQLSKRTIIFKSLVVKMTGLKDRNHRKLQSEKIQYLTHSSRE